MLMLELHHGLTIRFEIRQDLVAAVVVVGQGEGEILAPARVGMIADCLRRRLRGDLGWLRDTSALGTGWSRACSAYSYM
jgi:hypothetical protein